MLPGSIDASGLAAGPGPKHKAGSLELPCTRNTANENPKIQMNCRLEEQDEESRIHLKVETKTLKAVACERTRHSGEELM